MSEEKFESCLLCGSSRLIDLVEYEKNFLVKCQACRFIFCKRKPAASELDAHYQSYPRGTSISPITVKRYDELCNQFEKYRQTNNILDVGCGDGHFLVEAKKKGWNVFGTEYTAEAINLCTAKGIQMKRGMLEAAGFEPKFFDVITSFEVIEHINYPLNEALAMSSLLRPGGLLYVTTPNFNSLSRMLLGPKWNIIEYPEHLCYYTNRTLTKLFLQAGFELSALTSTGISIDRIRRSYQADAPAGEDVDEKFRQKAEANSFFDLTKAIANKVLDFFGKGDALKAFFIKR